MLRCLNSKKDDWLKKIKKCAVASLSGFPKIEIVNAFNNKYTFTSNDYFIFPTHKNTTTPINSFFGLYEVSSHKNNGDPGSLSF